MTEVWIRLDDLPADGRDFAFSEQEFWTERFAAFDMQVKPGKEITAKAHVIRQNGDALIRGSLTGSVRMPCDRCTETFEFRFDVSFSEFESRETENDGEQSRIVNDKGILTLNMGEILWEQLMLALPVKPTCTKTCQGICPQCGTNLNKEDCSCVQKKGDARLAVFRDLKVE